MRETFQNIKNQLSRKFSSSSSTEPSSTGEPAQTADYLEISHDQGDSKSKARVQQFVIEDFEDIKPVLDSLRTGMTVALVNIRPLKDRDIVELKRAVNKLKKTCDAIGGDLAGFGEDYIVATPEFAYIHRGEAPISRVEPEDDFI
jgi:SepF-like predicted cell division protein (DUF552 family)